MSDYNYDIYDGNEDFYDTFYEDSDEREWKYYKDKSSLFEEVYEMCAIPSFIQISTFIVPFILANVVMCIGLKAQARFAPSYSIISHALSSVLGIFLLYKSIQSDQYFLIILLVSVYMIMKFLENSVLRFDYVISIYAVVYLIVCELYETNRDTWRHIRGVLMVVVMKIISLVFDVQKDRHLKQKFTVLSFMGYMCCPANCVFGPWISFGEYLSLQTKAKARFKLNVLWITQLVLNVFMAMLCLLLSNCSEIFMQFGNSWKWIAAYTAAFSFRMSHYFISYLSQCTMQTTGFTSSSSSDTASVDRYFGYVVVRPASIEFPRSLVDVVIAWNIPMHHFLKQYVFRVLKPRGSFIAVLFTYLTSSLLHGLNFQLWAVLLTIGVLSYLEYNIRKKLAAIFSVCVMVNKCPKPCSKHKLGSNCSVAWIINVTFFALCIINLAYLGATFGSQSQQEDYFLSSAILKWQNLNYTSHWLIVAGLIFNWII